MVVCRYFLENKCRFGENCKFEHPRGGSQNSLFGQNDSWSKPRVTFGNDQNDKYKWSANQQQQGSQAQPMELINNLPREMELWEKSKMWPFSCVSIERDVPSLPGFYDVSVEELRLEAYGGLKSGNIQPYVEKVQKLTTEFLGMRQQLKQMTQDTKQKLIAFLDESRKKKKAPEGNSPFGQASQQQGGGASFGKSLFGSQAAASSGSNSSASAFGGRSPLTGSSFGSPGAGLFGKPQNQSAGQSSGFGTGLFGKSQSTSANPFAPSTQSGQTNSLFGASSSSTSANPFAGSATNPAPQSLFGKPAANQTSSVFGNSSTSVFGSASPGQGGQDQKPGLLGMAPGNTFGAAIPGAQKTGLLGDAPAQAQKPGLFGAGPSAVPGSQPQQSLFGSQQSGQQPQSLFGKPAAVGAPQSLFGKPAAVGAPQSLFGKPDAVGAPQSLFGKPASAGTQQSIFGKPAFSATAAQPQANQSIFGSSQALSSPLAAPATFGDSKPTSDVNPGRYTPLDQLTEAEIAEFRAPSFTLGKIPLRPPARELINI